MYRRATSLLVMLFVVLVLAVPSAVLAQMGVSSISVGSGEDALSSGITGVVRLESKDSTRYGEFAMQADQAWFVYGKKLNGKVSGFVAGSAGHFQGGAWVGPYVSLSTRIGKIGGKDLSIGTFHWPVFFIGDEPRSWQNDGVPNPEQVSVGYLGNASVTWGMITVSESYLDFLNDKVNWLPGVSLEVPMTGVSKGNFGYTWNGNKGKPMYYIGLTFSFGK